MNDRFRVTGLLASRLEELQVPLPAVLQHAGLAPGFFRQEKIFVSTSELFALWRAIREISGDPGIGLKLGAEARMERYDPASIAALHSRSFRDALQRMARYKQLTCPEKIRTLVEHGECVVEFQWLLAQNAEPSVLVDLCLSWILSIGRRRHRHSLHALAGGTDAPGLRRSNCSKATTGRGSNSTPRAMRSCSGPVISTARL
ncbi:MAG: AraC family transcriptional regulator ligand-binding domain-containing protein [Chthoniobacteraceae bacterium]